jgi:hypothetical protein
VRENKNLKNGQGRICASSSAKLFILLLVPSMYTTLPTLHMNHATSAMLTVDNSQPVKRDLRCGILIGFDVHVVMMLS